MERARDEAAAGPAMSQASIPAEPWLRDCWLVEVMPPTWAWAYRRLLNIGETAPRLTDRSA